MSSIERIFTPRLIGDRLLPEHIEYLDKMHQDPKVMATLAGVRSREQTQQFIEKEIAHWERYGFGLWIFRDKASGQFVGRAGIRHTHVNNRDEVELAYALMSEFWGQGFATEIGKTCLQIAEEELGLTGIVCFTMTTNLASQRVMQKLGFEYECDIIHANLPHMFYRLPN